MKQLSSTLAILFLGLGSLALGCATEIDTGEDGGGGSGGATGTTTVSSVASTTVQTTAMSSSTGMGCAQNCADVEVPECYVSVCNQATGMCEIEQAEDDSPCEDGEYCTIEDTCQDG